MDISKKSKSWCKNALRAELRKRRNQWLKTKDRALLPFLFLPLTRHGVNHPFRADGIFDHSPNGTFPSKNARLSPTVYYCGPSED